MYQYELSVLPPADPLPPEVDRTFYWHGKKSTPYFGTNVGPRLCEFGEVNNRNTDLVRIASAALSADHSASRSGRLSRWNQREISLAVDVLAIGPWNSVRTELESLLGFLTGDIWHLTFRRQTGLAEQLGTVDANIQRVVLLSGGADSAIGALVSAGELAVRGEQHILVSHWSANNLSPLQRRIGQEVERMAPGALARHIQIHHNRGRHSPSGAAYGYENSSRSRSLLFIAFGLAIASVHDVQLWIPENGYASLNPPLSRSRRGSLSTKTTHPKFLDDLVAILERVGAHHNLVNPFAGSTKGEMFARVRNAYGADEASAFLSATTSCAHTGARSFHMPPSVACGVCFGCVLRKASFQSAGLADATIYFKPVDVKQEAWIADRTVVPAMRDFLNEPFGESDLARLQIPLSTPLADMNELCRRGRDELRSLSL